MALFLRNQQYFLCPYPKLHHQAGIGEIDFAGKIIHHFSFFRGQPAFIKNFPFPLQFLMDIRGHRFFLLQMGQRSGSGLPEIIVRIFHRYSPRLS